ncbi:hypothetical protein [Citrobacter freundii]|uniref:hypothetical protein n=1 Tax=Citrobacter freundii TaxID=546 RepID=UPI001A1FC01D|nr:hypothetical protein [Citrobacter freundii]EJM7592366.1 hypothetical protein [Citrobacter freundii]EKV1387905.1 hypothetical protein [Citrobacter freundii]EKW0740702.1 hypothetical protein [Citrobacter freundii]ELP5236384.1 hypothetical protein [Citrobacter freundii]MCH9318075.1 hypothetical protein [Citrobacter freundii]
MNEDTSRISCVEGIYEEILLRISEKEAETGVKDSRIRQEPDDMTTVIFQAFESLKDNEETVVFFCDGHIEK